MVFLSRREAVMSVAGFQPQPKSKLNLKVETPRSRSLKGNDNLLLRTHRGTSRLNHTCHFFFCDHSRSIDNQYEFSKTDCQELYWHLFPMNQGEMIERLRTRHFPFFHQETQCRGDARQPWAYVILLQVWYGLGQRLSQHPVR
jgi:hypothetical protein